MATYKVKRKTNGQGGIEEIKIPLSSVDGTQNLVTTDTDQTITGSKTFNIEPLNVAGAKPFEIIRNDTSVFRVSQTDSVARIDIDKGGDGDVSLCLMGNSGTAGQVLTSDGAGATPVWNTLPIHTLTSESIRIWGLKPGTYVWNYAGRKTVYYSGGTGTQSVALNNTNGAVTFIVNSIVSGSNTYLAWVLFDNNTMSRYIRHGYTSQTSGTYQSYMMPSGTVITTSSVRNNLNTSTSSTSNALSGYQGYVLRRWIQEVAGYYGVCNTDAATAEKVVTITDSQNKFILQQGVKVSVLFTNGNTATNPTLNVGGTGAKEMWDTVETRTTSWKALSMVEFLYDGANWIRMSYSVPHAEKADFATLLGTKTVGYGSQPIWLQGGTPMVCSTFVKYVQENNVRFANTNSNITYAIQNGHQSIAQDGTATITFPTAFKNTSYSVVVLQGYANQGDEWLNGFRIQSKSTGSCQVKIQSSANTFDWIAVGQTP